MRVLALAILQVYFAEGFFPRPPTVYNLESDDGDPGEPLFLTPYIEAGQIEEARRLARVNLQDMPDIESYSGFFTVNKTYDSNHFFWYFPSLFTRTYKKQILLWLQGGPGTSSLYGLFEENGPIYVKKYLDGTTEILRRLDHWARFYHIIFIDNPVGTGFSFTNDSRGYCSDQTQIGEQLYNSVLQFFKLFPDLQNSEFFIAGQSYAGKYIPALGRTIHYKNPSAEFRINLHGMFIGNGWCDPINHLIYHKHLRQLGINPRYYIEQIKLLEWNVRFQIEQENWLEAFKQYSILINALEEKTKPMSLNNFLNVTSDDSQPPYVSLINASPMRKTIHVGNRTYQEDAIKVYNSLREDMMKSVAPWIAELLKFYRVMFFNGQLDILVAYPLTLNFLKKLDYPQREDYNKAPRYILLAKRTYDPDNTDPGTQIGYMKGYGLMGEYVSIGAGSMVPKDQPLWSCFMLVFLIQPPWTMSANTTANKEEFNVQLIKEKPIRIDVV